MNTRTLLLIILCLFVSVGCRRSSTPPPTAPPIAAAPSPELSHSQGGSTPVAQTKYFKGSIGSSLDLQMKLVRTGDSLSGSYFYQKIGTRIDLRGNVDQNGTLTLEEFDKGGKQTGVFKGIWQVDAKDGLITLAGNWSKPPDEKGSDKKTAFSLHEEPIGFTGDVELVSKQIKENDKKLMFEVDAQYPQLNGGNNPNFEKFNQTARALVTKKVAGFKKDMAPAEDEEPRPEGSMGSHLNVAYTLIMAQDDLISVKFDVGSYYQGAAHPNSYSDVINYDLKNGKQLKLGDLFKPGAKYLQAIADYAIADLKQQTDKGLIAGEIENGAAAVAKNYQSWNIMKTGIGVTFDAYQVGPYAAGPQFVTVPYSALKDLINPEGPIAQFAK
jgi:uncharacterized protein DUF3298/peptidoglycan-N-acetylmuramic acid deacetylase PdaC-like protein